MSLLFITIRVVVPEDNNHENNYIINGNALGYFNTTGFANQIVIVDDILYLADEISGLAIFDISDAPSLVSLCNYSIGMRVQGICVVDDLVYMANDVNGISIANISNPVSPTFVGALDWSYVQYPERAIKLKVIGNFAYVCDLDDDFKVINVTNPSAPTLVGDCYYSSSARGLAIKDSYAFVASWNNILEVIDINDPTNPIPQYGYFDGISYANDIQIKDNYAYIADWEKGLHVFDIQNPTAPVLKKTVNPIHAMGLDIICNLVYVTETNKGVNVFTIEDPENPLFLGLFLASGYINDVTVECEYLYVAAGETGIVVFDAFGFTHDPITITLPPVTVTPPPVTVTPPPETITINNTNTAPFGIITSSTIFIIAISLTVITLISRRKRK